MNNSELRKTLEEHLDLLKRNLAVASLEVLKTKYKKPFDELRHNIKSTATAYVKQCRHGWRRPRTRTGSSVSWSVTVTLRRCAATFPLGNI